MNSGGVKLSNKTADKHGNKPIQAAKAIRLVYVLAPVLEADEWIKEFINIVGSLQYEDARLFYTSSLSLPQEMERNGAVKEYATFLFKLSLVVDSLDVPNDHYFNYILCGNVL